MHPQPAPLFRLSRPALLLAVTIIALFRRPDAFFQPQLFVEDGTVFFRDDYELGFYAIFKPYAGYLHLLPRLVAYGASLAPLEVRPRIYTYACLLLLWAIALMTVGKRIELPNKPLFALAPLLFPIGPFIYLHLTNMQWFSAILLLLLILQRPAENLTEALGDSLVALVVGLTGPFSLVFCALVPWKVVFQPLGKRDWLPIATLTATAVVQGRLLWQASHASQGGFEYLSGDFLSTQGTRFALGDVASYLVHGYRQWPAIFLVLSLCAIAANHRQGRPIAMLLLITTAVFGVLGLYRIQPEAAHASAFRSGIRYFFMPHLGATYLFVLGISNRGWTHKLATLWLGISLLSACSRFSYRPPKNLHFERYCDRIRAGEPVTIPIHHRGWRIKLNAR